MHKREDIAVAPPCSERRDDAEMFDLAPVSLWLEDFSGVKAQFDEWRRAGVVRLPEFLREDAGRVKACCDLIRVIKVNRKTLTLFGADDLSHLVENLGAVFRDDMLKTHIDELGQLWDGQTEFSSHTVNYTLSGRRLDIQLKGSILPGYEGPDRHRGRHRAGECPAAARCQRDLCAWAVRAFAGVALG
jgi:hypothetical protein